MNQDQLSDGFANRRLRMDQDLDARLGVVEFRMHWEALLVQVATPVVARDGEQVRIPEKGDKGPQRLFYSEREEITEIPEARAWLKHTESHRAPIRTRRDALRVPVSTVIATPGFNPRRVISRK